MFHRFAYFVALLSFKLKASFVAQNVAALKTVGAGDVLLDMCESLPFLQRFIGLNVEASSGSATVPSASDANLPKARCIK